MSLKQISRKAANKWRELPDFKKAEYEKQVKNEKANFELFFPCYKFSRNTSYNPKADLPTQTHPLPGDKQLRKKRRRSSPSASNEESVPNAEAPKLSLPELNWSDLNMPLYPQSLPQSPSQLPQLGLFELQNNLAVELNDPIPSEEKDSLLEIDWFLFG